MIARTIRATYLDMQDHPIPRRSQLMRIRTLDFVPNTTLLLKGCPRIPLEHGDTIEVSYDAYCRIKNVRRIEE